MSKWVQSKYSKDAKKWEVLDHHMGYYHIKHKGLTKALLEDEYIECDPPERWETCTKDYAKINERGEFEWVIVLPTFVNHRWAWSKKDSDALVMQKKVLL